MALIKWSPFRRIQQIIRHYVESGFLELGVTAKCTEATFLPAVLRLRTGVASYANTSSTPLLGAGNIDVDNGEMDNPFYGNGMSDGDISLTCAGVSLTPQVSDACGNTYLSDTPDYGSETMWLLKATQRYVPSSYFSGKLRLYIQAVYGSTRMDYGVPLGESGLPDTSQCLLYLDNFPITSQMPTSGLFTDSNYNYWLMSVEISRITFYPLILTTTAEQWRDFFKTHPNKTNKFFSARVEAYILAYAIVDTDNPVVRNTGANTPGAPMGFGFKFNWAGNEASIVLHELDLETGYNYSRTLTLNIADDLQVTHSETAPKLWVNGLWGQYWAPDHYNYWLNSFGKVLGGDVNQDAVPMYGYYVNDVWTPFTVSCAVQTAQTYNEPVTWYITQENLTGAGYDAPTGADREFRSGTNVLSGFIGYSFGEESVNIPQMGSHNRVWRRNCYIRHHTETFTAPIHWTFFGGAPPDTLEHGPLGDHMVSTYPYHPGVKGYGWQYSQPYHMLSWGYGPDGLNPDSTSQWKAMQYQTNNTNIEFGDCGSKSGYSEGGSIMMAVPLGDCEAVIFGTSKNSGWSSGSTFSYTSPSALARGPLSRILDMQGIAGSDAIVLGVSETLHNKQYLYSSNIFNDGSHNTVTHGAGGQNTTSINYAHSGVGGWSHAEISGYELKTSSASVQGLPEWARTYFLPGDVTGPYRPVIAGKTSLGGANILFHSLNEEGYSENGYPYGTYNAVGFA